MTHKTIVGNNRCSQYVGRVGGLAIALGVGLAVANAPAVAWADEASASPGASAQHKPTDHRSSAGSKRPTSASKTRRSSETLSAASTATPKLKPASVSENVTAAPLPPRVASTGRAKPDAAIPQRPLAPSDNPLLLSVLAWARKEFVQSATTPSAQPEVAAAVEPPLDGPSYADLRNAQGYVLGFPGGGNPAFVDPFVWSPGQFTYEGETYTSAKLDQLGTFAAFQCGGSCEDTTPYLVVFVNEDLNDDGLKGCSQDSCIAVSAKPLEVGDISPYGQLYGPMMLGYNTTSIQYAPYVMVFRDNAVSESLSTLPESFIPAPPPPPAGDVTPPTAPTIKASGWTDSSVVLKVFGGTDDVGIVNYYLFRDGTQIATLHPGDDTYVDKDLDFDVTYSYTALAEDAAGNLSGLTKSVKITTYTPEEWEYKSGNDPGWEKAWENINIAFGWIPVVNDVLATVSTCLDVYQLVAAIAAGDKHQIYEEIADLGGDMIGFIPFAKAIDTYLATPVTLEKALDGLGLYLAGLLYEAGRDAVGI